MSNKHKNYEILNLIGYGLAKFDNFVEVFGFKTKTDFYRYCLDSKIAESSSVIKNRQDLFDPFFDNGRKGWWQNGESYIHRKDKIDLLFGNETVKNYVEVIKIYLQTDFGISSNIEQKNPITISRFRKMQETGLEAELYFMKNFEEVRDFKGGKIDDARLYGDGYDFQISINKNFFLVEVKGIREERSGIRITEKEFLTAKEYGEDYFLSVISNLNDIPKIRTIKNPLKELEFKKVEIKSRPQVEYQLIGQI